MIQFAKTNFDKYTANFFLINYRTDFEKRGNYRYTAKKKKL